MPFLCLCHMQACARACRKSEPHSARVRDPDYEVFYLHDAMTFCSSSANRGTIAEYVACRSASGVAAMLTWGSASAASASRSVWPYGTWRIFVAVST